MEILAEIEGCSQIKTLDGFADDQVLIDMKYKADIKDIESEERGLLNTNFDG